MIMKFGNISKTLVDQLAFTKRNFYAYLSYLILRFDFYSEFPAWDNNRCM